MYKPNIEKQFREGYTLGRKLREAMVTGITPALALNGQCDTDSDDFIDDDGTPSIDPHGDVRFEMSDLGNMPVGKLRKFMEGYGKISRGVTESISEASSTSAASGGDEQS